MQHELGNPELSFLQFGYLAGKEGLLAGEKLYFDIKRMEMAYHDLNQREYELTKHVSLLQVNPHALLQLRTTGRCAVYLPEELFDFDAPGHYFRRIKSVALSIPCVAGPYTSVNCTLTLRKSSIRKNALLHGDIYAREGAEDDRFSDYFGSLQSIVTSGSQNDSGLFETNLRDERYLPFEGAGLISEWQLELPAQRQGTSPGLHQFDYDTINDVIIHLRYTAREGGAILRKSAAANLTEQIKDAQTTGSMRLFSIRHEFPSEWARFKSVETGPAKDRAELLITLKPEHYPFWSKSGNIDVRRLEMFARAPKGVVSYDVYEARSGEGKDTLTNDDSLGGLKSGKLKTLLASPTAKFSRYFDDNSMDDLWVALTWGWQ